MMTINNEKFYTEYEISVIQELTNILASKFKEIEWHDGASEWEINKFVRTELFSEFHDYLVSQDYIDSTSVSISEADFSSRGSSDLDEIDAFCEIVLQGMDYYSKKKEIEEETPDCSFVLVTDLAIRLSTEFDDRLATKEESWVERNEYFCQVARRILHTWDRNDWSEICDKAERQVAKELDERGCEKITSKKAAKKMDDEVAYILVQLTEDFSKDLYEKYDKTMNDTCLRGDFLLKMAVDIANSDEWNDGELTSAEVIEKAIEAKKNELLAKKAKFHVNDEVYYFNFDMQKFYVKNVKVWSGEIYYDLGYRLLDKSVECDEIPEKVVFASVSDFITSMQTRLDNGEFDK